MHAAYYSVCLPARSTKTLPVLAFDLAADAVWFFFQGILDLAIA